MSLSLNASERVSAQGATAPRVSLDDIHKAVMGVEYFTVGDALDAMGMPHPGASMTNLHILTLCVVALDNGFVVIGKSAPASPENFDAGKGRLFAYEDAIRQIWPLMVGFALRERLAQEK